MATDDWTKKSLKIQQETEKAEAYKAGMQNALMMIGKAHPPGELPPYVPPDKPSSPWEPGKSPAPSRQKLASTQIRSNQIMLPFVPKDAETDEDWGEGETPGHPGWKISHEGHTPESTYDDDGRPERVPRYKGGSPGGKQIDIDWMKEEYQKKHPELEQLHNEKYHQASIKNSLERENVGGTLRDMILPLLIKEYGKDSSGKYKNPGALLSIMKKLG